MNLLFLERYRRPLRAAIFALIIIAAAVLTGCGGGGGGGTTTTSQPVSSSGPFCGVTLQNSLLTVSTHNVEIVFKGSIIQSIKNVVTGETLIQAPGPGIIDLNLQEPTGSFLSSANWTTQADPAAGKVGKLVLSDSQRQVTMTVGCDTATDEAFVRMEGQSSKAGVRGLVWGIQGFSPTGRFVLPVHAGVYFDYHSPTPNFEFMYPTHWEAQFAIYESSSGGLLLYARDPRPYFKQLKGTREFGTLDLVVQTFALGPWQTATSVPTMEWRFKGYQGSWRNAVDVYRAWSKTAFSKRAADSRRDWTRRIRAVLTVTDPDTSCLDAIAQLLDPTKVLIYMVDWRTDSYDSNYPDYTPKPGTVEFIQYAHQLGFHVMLHTNVVGVSTSNPVYASVSQYQLRDPDSGELMYWPWGLWPAGDPPPSFLQSYAFISTASSSYRSIYKQRMQDLVAAVQPDALHLDAGGVMLNDGNGLIEGMTSIDGMIKLHQEMAELFPQLPFSYESMTEALVGFHDFAQRWPAELPSHPAVAYLEGDQITPYGFLDQPNPDESSFIDYIRHYEAQGVLPTLTFDRAKTIISHLNDLSTSLPISYRMLQVLKLWQQYDFHPDWNGDWTGLRFRYVGSDGTTTATIQDSGGIVSLNAAGQTVYRRASNVNLLQTTSFIPSWTAYDPSTLFGLDPSWEYWLRDDSQRPTDSLRLTDLPEGVVLGRGTLDSGTYGYFELDNVAKPGYDFILSFGSAKVGVASANGLDFRLAYGAMAQVTQTPVLGKVRAPVILMQPPTGLMLGGATFVDYKVDVPSSQSFLTFNAGMSDFAAHTDGVVMKVTINGTEVWKQSVTTGQWLAAEVNLSPWAGTTVNIRFLMHPGPTRNAIDDYAVWGGLALTTKQSANVQKFTVAVPAGSSVSTSSEVQLTSTGDSSRYAASATMPAKFVVFSNQPPTPRLGDSLLSIAPDVWKKSNLGFAIPFRVEASGSIGAVTCGGQSKTAIALYPPERGYSLASWAVQIPVDASQLSFSVGLADPPPPLTSVEYTGAAFAVLINGKSVWDLLIQSSGWTDATLDLSPWRGQNVVITLQVDSNGAAMYDWGNWAGLTIQ